MIGIIGSGIMGKSIAIEIAKSGKEVIIFSAQRYISNEKLLEELKAIMSQFRIQDFNVILDKVHIVDEISDFIKCNLIIEVVKEDLNIKRMIINKFAKIVQSGTIFSSNTSSLSLKYIFDGIWNLENVIGFHFFNPPNIMRLIEITYLQETSNSTKDFSRGFAEEIGKVPVILSDSPGLIVNKLLLPYINNAVKLLESGIASKEDIDKAMMLGANHPMGPLKLADLIGLDIVYSILRTFINNGENIEIAETIIHMVKDNKLGRKTKIGFYDYSKRN